jgi:hypothetical protein
MVAVKVIVLAYLGSVLIRLIFGGRTWINLHQFCF